MLLKRQLQGEFPSSLAVRTLGAFTARVQVRSLGGELGSQKPSSTAEKKNTTAQRINLHIMRMQVKGPMLLFALVSVVPYECPGQC